MKSPFVMRRVLFTAVLACLAVVGAALAAPAVASADPYPPTSGCALSGNQEVTGGQSLTVTGSGFPANSTVQLSISPEGMSLGNVQAGADGSFTDTVTIPPSIQGSNHTVVANGGDISCSFNPFANAGVAGVSTHRNNGGSAHTGGTATTGFAAITASVVAVLLLGGGLLLVTLGRRRRQS